MTIWDLSALPKTLPSKSIITSAEKMDLERKDCVQSYQSLLYVRFLFRFGNNGAF